MCFDHPGCQSWTTWPEEKVPKRKFQLCHQKIDCVIRREQTLVYKYETISARLSVKWLQTSRPVACWIWANTLHWQSRCLRWSFRPRFSINLTPLPFPSKHYPLKITTWINTPVAVCQLTVTVKFLWLLCSRDPFLHVWLILFEYKRVIAKQTVKPSSSVCLKYLLPKDKMSASTLFCHTCIGTAETINQTL